MGGVFRGADKMYPRYKCSGGKLIINAIRGILHVLSGPTRQPWCESETPNVCTLLVNKEDFKYTTAFY